MIVSNRKRVINKFIGNFSNAVTHSVLENAADDAYLKERYQRETDSSILEAMKWRITINPDDVSLPDKDIQFIRTQTRNRSMAALRNRLKEGYTNIELSMVEKVMDVQLKQTGIE